MMNDDRIPVRFGTLLELRHEDAVLLDGRLDVQPPAGLAIARFATADAHVWGCACCGGGRDGVAVALGRLFRDRALGRVPWFRSVLALVADESAVAASLTADRLVAARFTISS